MKIGISVKHLFPSGDLLLSAYYDNGDEYGDLITQIRYSGYSRRDALRLFRAHIKEALTHIW